VVNRKNQSKLIVNGHIRLAAAVNSYEKVEALSFRNKVSDVNALLARMLIIHCRPEAKELFNYRLFVEQNAIAQHCLWLKAEREEDIVESGAPYGIRKLQNTPRNAVRLLDQNVVLLLDWVCEFLEQRLGESEKKPPAFVAKGRVYVHFKTLYENWEKVFGLRSRPPRRNDLLSGFQSLTNEEEEIRVKIPAGNNLRYLPVHSKLLEARAETADFDLSQQLAIYTEQVTIEENYFRLPHKLYPTPEDREARQKALNEIDQGLWDVGE